MSGKHGRRRFIRGLGASVAALPFLRPASVFADTLAPQRRLVLFVVKNGTTLERFFPSAGTVTGSQILAPLASWESQITVLRGIDHKSARQSPIPPDHQPDFPNLMAGTQRAQGARIAGCTDERESRCHRWSYEGTSLDQVMADRFRGETAYPSLHLGVRAPQGYVSMSFREGGEVFWAENDPFVVHERLFERFRVGAEAYEQILQRRRSVLDAVRAEVTAASRAVGRDHRDAFCRNLDAIRDVERTLTGGGGACAVPTLDGTFDVRSEANFARTTAAQRQLLTAALRCDLTRVAVLQLGSGEETWDSLGLSLEGGWHAYLHDGGYADRAARQADVSTFFAEQFAALLADLAAVPEGDGGTLLDNCAVVWMHEQAVTSSHQRTDVPYVLAGRCGGSLRAGGRFVDLRRGDEGRPNNDLLLTLCHAMGDERATFGDPDYNGGPISELLA
jgi:hypothetical protein